MMKRLIAVFLCVTAWSVSLFPLTRIDVDSAVARAIENNLTLKMAAVDLAMLRHTKDTNWNLFVPSVSADASVSRSNAGMIAGSPASEGDRWKMDAGISASMNLGASSFNTFQKNIRDYENGLIAYEDAVSKLELSVKKAFYDLLVQTEDIRISTFSLTNAERKYRQDEENYRKGLVSEMVMLKSRVAYETAKNTVEGKKSSYSVALASFRALLGLARDEEIELTGTLNPRTVTLNAQELIDSYLYQRSDVKSEIIKLEELRIQKNQLYLTSYTPVLSASYGVSYGNVFNNPGFSDSGALTLKISIPLDSFIPGTKSNNLFYDAQKRIERQELSFQSVVDNAKNKVYSSAMLINQSAARIESLKLTEQIAQRSYDLTYAAYQKGQVPWSDVTDAQEALDTARQRVLAEQYSYRSQLLDLEDALNTRLTEN